MQKSKQPLPIFTSTHPFRWRDTLSAVLGDVFLDPNLLHVRDVAQGRSIEIVIDLDLMKLVAIFFSLLRSHRLCGHGLVALRGLGLGVSLPSSSPSLSSSSAFFRFWLGDFRSFFG